MEVAEDFVGAPLADEFAVLIPAMHARAGQSYFHRHIAPARVPSLDSAPMQFTDRIILLEHVSLHFVTTLLQ